MWSTTVEVSSAAYHIKFLVDGVWKTSDALPLATDSGGRLVNYIDVRTKGPEIKEWGRDWWGVGTEEEEEQGSLFFPFLWRKICFIFASHDIFTDADGLV